MLRTDDSTEPTRMFSRPAAALVVAGRVASPIASNDLSALYRAPAGNGMVSWSFRILSTNPDAVDVVAVGSRAGPERSAAQCLAR